MRQFDMGDEFGGVKGELESVLARRNAYRSAKAMLQRVDSFVANLRKGTAHLKVKLRRMRMQSRDGDSTASEVAR